MKWLRRLWRRRQLGAEYNEVLLARIERMEEERREREQAISDLRHEVSALERQVGKEASK